MFTYADEDKSKGAKFEEDIDELYGRKK